MTLEIVNIIKLPIAELNESEIGYVNSPEDKLAGIVSPTLGLYVLKTESGENMVVVGKIEPLEEGGLNILGLIVHDNGKVAIGGKIFLQKKAFDTHEAALNSLESGEEYYLEGDNNVYRKV